MTTPPAPPRPTTPPPAKSIAARFDGIISRLTEAIQERKS